MRRDIGQERSVSMLPEPVARFRALADRGGAPTIETMVIETRAWMRRPGWPRIPLEIRMVHRLGYEFVHDIRIGRGRLSFRFGLDAYVGRHGLMRVGPSVQTGVKFDQGALIALWGEALCFPSAWDARADIRWEPGDEDTSGLIVQGPEGELPITVGFDPDTGLPAYCTADRYRAKGPKVGWTGRFSEWRRFEGDVLAPGRYEVQWSDEPFPWIEIRTVSLSLNQVIDDALRLGRDAFRAVDGAPARPAPSVRDDSASKT